MASYTRDLPKECRDIVDELVKMGFEIHDSYFDQDSKSCIIDFVDKDTLKSIGELKDKIPFGRYVSRIDYNIETKQVALNLVKVPKRDVVAYYITEEDKERPSYYIEVDYSGPRNLRLFSVSIAFTNKEKAFEKIKNFFSTV